MRILRGMRPTECESCGSKKITFEYSKLYSLGHKDPTHRRGQLVCEDCGWRRNHIEVIGGEDPVSIPHTDSQEIETRFTYHPPKEGQPEKYTQLRNLAKGLARCIDDTCPDSREKSLAITKLEETVMWANAAIARRG